MDYTIEEVSPTQRKVVVNVPQDEVEASLKATIALYRRSADMKGFRKGKVPSSVIEGRYKKQIYTEATTDLVNLHINEIMGELKLAPVSGIDFDGKELVKGEAFDYSFSFEVMPDFEIPDYSGIEVEEEKVEVKEDEIEAVVERVRKQLAEIVDVDEKREPRDGEIAVITFQAEKDGKPLDEVKAENFDLPLGEGQALEVFESIVKKLKPGEIGQEDMTFPEDFMNQDLAGQTVSMRVTLKAIKTRVLPEKDDDFAKKAGGFESVDKMREAVENSYMESRKQLSRSKAQKKLLDKALSMVDFPVPESMVNRHVDRMFNELSGRLEGQGKSVASLGKTEEELREGFKADAEDLSRSEIFLLAVAKKEGIAVSEQELDFFFQQMAARTGDNFNQLKRFHMENNLMHAVQDRLLADKAMELVYSRAAIKEVEPAEAAESVEDKDGE